MTSVIPLYFFIQIILFSRSRSSRGMSYFSWKGAGRRRRASADRARPRSGRENAGPESTPPPGDPTSPWKAVQAWRGRRRAAGADRGRGRPCQTSGSASRANVVLFLPLTFRRGFARNHSYKGGFDEAGRSGG